MAFILSPWIAPFSGDGDGGGNTSPPEKLPLPYWLDVDSGTVAALNPTYQVPKLLYMVTRNGVLQRPNKDFTFSNSLTLAFVEPFTEGECVGFFPTGFSV